MQGDRLALQALNKNLGLLLVSINQYFYMHGYYVTGVLPNWVRHYTNIRFAI